MTEQALATVLVVDDTPENLALMRGLLKDHYKTLFATNGEQALKVAREHRGVDIILLDVMMPVMDGYEVCRQLKADERTRGIPVIFLTAKSQVEDERLGLDLGAVDYITKPISPPLFSARVRNHLLVKQARDQLANQNQLLEQRVRERTQALVETQDATIYAMSALAETRDNETGNHIRRTQHYVRALAQALQALPDFQAELSDEVIDLLYKSAPLHDIGKVGIPDRVLLKPGKLDPDEWVIMKKHVDYGRDAIRVAESQMHGDSSFLRLAREIAYGHHEKWDGTGYPQGLVGDAIPLSARLMAVADVYDALISRRVYKPPFSHEVAVGMIVEGRGRHFDPRIVDVFVGMAEQFKEIAQRFADHE
jgi:putative two-component system response regulator